MKNILFFNNQALCVCQHLYIACYANIPAYPYVFNNHFYSSYKLHMQNIHEIYNYFANYI